MKWKRIIAVVAVLISAVVLGVYLVVTGAIYMPSAWALHAKWSRLKNADYAGLRADAPGILARCADAVQTEKRNRGWAKVRIEPRDWPKSVTAYQPQVVFACESNLFLWWGDHVGEYGVRVFASDVDSNTAVAASTFIRTFECTEITNGVWFYTGD